MSYYNVCPHCGANLDPGERCDCRDGRRIIDYRCLKKGMSRAAYSKHDSVNNALKV